MGAAERPGASVTMPAGQQWTPTKAQRIVLVCLADVAANEGGHIILRNRYHSAAAALVRRGYVEKIDRDLYRPLYIITPAGLKAWRSVEERTHRTSKDK